MNIPEDPYSSMKSRYRKLHDAFQAQTSTLHPLDSAWLAHSGKFTLPSFPFPSPDSKIRWCRCRKLPEMEASIWVMISSSTKLCDSKLTLSQIYEEDCVPFSTTFCTSLDDDVVSTSSECIEHPLPRTRVRCGGRGATDEPLHHVAPAFNFILYLSS